MERKNTRRGCTQANKNVVIKRMCPEVFVLRTFHACRGKNKGETLFHNNRRVEDPRLQPSGMTPLFNNGGFTLIELLVVVLIIGILAAVALPQYQKAVYRSKYATIKALVHSIADAEEIYYLANGEYTNQISALDIDIGGAPGVVDPNTNRDFDWGRCYVGGKDHTKCEDYQIGMGYQMYFPHSTNPYKGERWCVADGNLDTSSLQHKICQAETGKDTLSHPSWSGIYVY